MPKPKAGMNRTAWQEQDDHVVSLAPGAVICERTGGPRPVTTEGDLSVSFAYETL